MSDHLVGRRRALALTPMETRLDVIGRAARLADELGYEAFSVPEGWGLDAGAVIAGLIPQTRRIRFVTGVLSVWGRTPATLAMGAATLQAMSGGRYVLGLGASSPALVEGLHDQAFTRPSAKLREVTVAVRALLDGSRPQLTAAPSARPVRLGLPATPELPIWLAAVGTRSARVAAETADGWIPAWLSRPRLAELAPQMADARAAAGIRSAPLTVVSGPWVVAADDPGEARSRIAAVTAWYLCAMGDWPKFVAAQGFGPQVDSVRAANPRPHPGKGVVPDEAQALLDAFTAHGTPDDVRRQVAEWDGCVDIVSIGLPPGLPWELLEATIRAAAPSTASGPG